MAVDAPNISVLLGLFNGARFLRAQLDSIATQTLQPSRILISDDGSTDESADIVQDFAASWDGEIVHLDGPSKGFAANFLHMIGNCPSDSDMVAFSDQDDVWLEGKLRRQWDALKAHDGPTLHGSRTWITDAELNKRRISSLMTIGPSFAHALVQNLAGGNTLAVNKAGLDIAKRAAQKTGALIAHDWWLYQLFTGTGNTVLYDPEPLVLYRQHGDNLMGENSSRGAIRHRAAQLRAGQYRIWTDVNLKNLKALDSILTDEARDTVAAFQVARAGALPRRVKTFSKSGIRRQGVMGQLTLWAAVLSGKI